MHIGHACGWTVHWGIPSLVDFPPLPGADGYTLLAMATSPASAVPGRPDGVPRYGAELAATAWLIVVAGVVLGLGIGVLMRAAMFALRVAQPSAVGTTSDDGFEIGKFTLSGTYNLLNLGVAIGVIAVAAYVAVRPLMIGPGWFRATCVGLTAMFIGGSGVIHADGADFTVLDTELAVALFLALPLAAGLATPAVADAVWARHARWPLWLPAIGVVTPLALIPAAVVLAVVAVLLPVRRALLDPIVARSWAAWLMRGAFAVIPAVALASLLGDFADLF